MKDLRKTLTLAVVGIALFLGVFVLTSNAQHRRGRSGISFSISYGQPNYRQHRSSRRYYRQPTHYVTRQYYGSGYNNGYSNNGYYNNGYNNNGYSNNGYYNNSNRRYSRSRRNDRDRDCDRDRSYNRNSSYRDRRNW